MTTAISIPSHLLPRDGRFGSGPSRVSQDALSALSERGTAYMGTSHRKPTVKQVVSRIRSGLSDLYALPEGHEVVLGVGGATAFWDAAAFGLIEHRSAHYVCGEFSAKFAAVVTGAPHLAEPVVISATPPGAPDPEPTPGVDVAAFIHNETSTGVRAEWARFGDELIVVDGTSAAGAVPIDPSTVDAYYFSPQKAFGSEGGLWLALMSPSAIDRVGSIAAWQRWTPPFLSLQTAIENSLLDQTYNTPALATLYLLEARISELLAADGLSGAARVAQASSDHLYRWAEASDVATPFVTDDRLRSTTVVTIDFIDTVDANVLSEHLRSNGIVDTESYRKLGRNQLRIATFPTIPTSDVEALTGCIDYVIAAM
ncbi:MAG TPA: phosphoserine transaminase [Acidimicrobiia bacterium]|nr:phosphoserine transaminase [Acidimicrobiia bacterium]